MISRMYKEIVFKAASSVMEYLTPWSTDIDLSNYVFRGHSDDNYKLLPSAFRYDNIEYFSKISKVKLNKDFKYYNELRELGLGYTVDQQAQIEFNILRDFYRKANISGLYVPRSRFMSHAFEKKSINIDTLMRLYKYDKWLNRNVAEIAALAQHYGLPTRLMDWSYNPYTAAFFASRASKKDKSPEYISIWMINYKLLSKLSDQTSSKIKMYNPHYQWNDNARSQSGLFIYRQESIGRDFRLDKIKFLANLYENRNSGFNLDMSGYGHLVADREEFDKTIIKMAEDYNLLKAGNSDEQITAPIIIKLLLPHNEAGKLNYYLRSMRVTEASVFPGYAGVVESIKSRVDRDDNIK